MVKEWYTVGCEENAPKLEHWQAVNQARLLGLDSETMIWVYGHRCYSPDDPTPIAAQTTFWRDCGFSCMRVSHDGT